MRNDGNTDVQTAFELLTTTLDEERRRIFAAGSKAMERQDAKVARGVLDFVEKLDVSRLDVQKLQERWHGLQDANDIAPHEVQEIVVGDGKLFTTTRKHKSGYSRTLDHPLAPKSGFSITFPDGTVFAKKKAADSFVQAIGRIGSRRILSLNLLLNGEPLIADAPFGKYKPAWHRTPDGFYVCTHCSTDAKAKLLATISKKLGLDLKIEVSPGKAKEE